MRRADFLMSGALAAAAPAVPPVTPAARLPTSLAGASEPITPERWNANSETNDPQRRTALVLSGGIAQGVYEAGVVRSLIARNYHFDVICGTSIGALNGALIAQGDHVLLSEIWASIGSKPIKKLEHHAQLLFDAVMAFRTDRLALLNRYVFPAFGIGKAVDHGKIAQVMGAFDPAAAQSVLRPLDLRKVRTPFMFAVTNVDVGRAEAVYANPPGHPVPSFNAASSVPVNILDVQNQAHVALYAEAVRASGALPFAFAPVPLPGLNRVSTVAAPHHFGDGGVANNTPVRLARKLGVTDMICVFMAPRSDPKAPPPPPAGNLVEALLNMYTANQNQLLDDEILLALESRNSLRRSEQTASFPVARTDRLINIYEVRPASDLGINGLDFDKQDLLDRGYARGLEDGMSDPTPYPDPVQPISI